MKNKINHDLQPQSGLNVKFIFGITTAETVEAGLKTQTKHRQNTDKSQTNHRQMIFVYNNNNHFYQSVDFIRAGTC